MAPPPRGRVLRFPSAGSKTGRRRVRTVAAITLLVFFAGGLQAAWGYERGRAAHLLPETTIGGVDVGGLAADDAAVELRESIERVLHRRLVLHAGGETIETTPWDVGLRVDVERAVSSALREQRELSGVRRLWQRIFGGGQSHELAPALQEDVLARFVTELASNVDRPKREASISEVDGWLRVVPAHSGRSLDRTATAKALVAATASGAREVKVPVRVSDVADPASSAILVHTASNKLYLYRYGKIAKTYTVATGMRKYPTPHGRFWVTGKRVNPAWGNPGAPWSADMPDYIAPGPDNPLGTRAMNLSSPGIRIHGTSDIDSLGSSASHGCIRMAKADVEELFDLVPVGTQVVIVRA